MHSLTSAYHLLVLALFMLWTTPSYASSEGLLPHHHGLIQRQTDPIPDDPFTLQKAFTKTLTVGPVSPAIQLPDSTRQFVVVPLNNITVGRVEGPLLNGTVYSSGFGTGERYGTYNFQKGYEWGVTDDGETFMLLTSGVSNSGGAVSRVEITIGGAYAYLSESFLLATSRVVLNAYPGGLNSLTVQHYVAGSTFT